MTCFKFPFFFLMLNEIILFQFLYRHLEYIFVSFMKVKIVKFIQLAMFYIKYDPIYFFNFNFWIFLHCNRVLGFYHSHNLCTLVLKVFVVIILGQKNLFRRSLWIIELFFKETKYWIFFQYLVGILKLVQIWHAIHRILR
jgi:hypothetical protein